MHYMADDLATGARVRARVATFRRYLACWRLFMELDQWALRRHTRSEEG